MSDRDNITLPREVGKLALDYIEWDIENERGGRFAEVRKAAEALRTALAAEQPKPEPVATVGTQSAAWKGYDGRWSPPGDPIKVVHLLRDLPLGTLLYTAPPDAPTVKDSLTVQSRLDAESFREERDEARALLNGVLQDIEALRRDAERYRYLRSRDPKEVFDKSGKAAGVWIDWEDDLSGLQLLTGDDADAAIDAAMKEDKT